MATNTWIAAAPGNSNVPGNWSLGHVPQAGEDVVFDLTSVMSCTLVGSTAFWLATFRIQDSYTGTFTQNAGTYIYTNGTVYIGTGVTYVLGGATAGISQGLTAAASLTTNGRAIGVYSMSGAFTLTLQDPLSCQALQLTGSFDQNGQAITCTSFYSSHASSIFDAAITVAGACTFQATPASSASAVFSVTANAALYFRTMTISRLILTAGRTYLWNPAGGTLTVSNHVAGDWDNTIWASGTPTLPYDISAPAGVVVSGLNVTDCHNTGTEVDASDGTCTDGGRNYGFLFVASSSSSCSSSSSSTSSTSSSSSSSSSAAAATESIEARITASLQTAFTALNTYGGVATVERERAVLQIGGRFPFVEICGPQTEIDDQQFKVGINRLTYVVRYYVNTNDEDTIAGHEITYLTRNVCADIIKAARVSPHRGSLALNTKAVESGYGFEVDEAGTPLFFRYVVLEVTARIDSANPYLKA